MNKLINCRTARTAFDRPFSGVRPAVFAADESAHGYSSETRVSTENRIRLCILMGRTRRQNKLATPNGSKSGYVIIGAPNTV